jgi:hypothetical protein
VGEAIGKVRKTGGCPRHATGGLVTRASARTGVHTMGEGHILRVGEGVGADWPVCARTQSGGGGVWGRQGKTGGGRKREGGWGVAGPLKDVQVCGGCRMATWRNNEGMDVQLAAWGGNATGVGGAGEACARRVWTLESEHTPLPPPNGRGRPGKDMRAC